MRAVDQILLQQRERTRRLEVARAAVEALTRDERHELLAELIQAEEGAPASSQAPPAPATVSLLGGTPTIREAITAVLSGCAPLESNEVYALLAKTMPDVNKGSVTSEIHKMLAIDPPLLVKYPGKGRVGRYALPSYHPQHAGLNGFASVKGDSLS